MPSPTNNSATSRRRTISYGLVLIAWLVLVGLAINNRQAVIDWWTLRGYSPPSSIAALASDDTMTPSAEHLYYINKPQLDDKSRFPKHCPNNGGEQTIVLGCYHSTENGIYLLNVSDPRLNGVEQVTAAHEMLHAAYDRLSQKDKTYVDGLLLDYYHRDLKDPRLLATMAAYQKSEPHDVVNEMHSVFGTEVAELPPALENYYKRYFSNRQQVAAYAANYQSEFTSRQTEVAQDEKQLSGWLNQINSLQNDLVNKQNQLTAEQDNLVNLQKSGNLTAYNAGVPAFNQAVDSYNTEVQQLKGLIASYNELVNQHNALVLVVDQLAAELSTKQTPINK